MAYRRRCAMAQAQVAQQAGKGKLAEAARQLGGDSLDFSISFISALVILLRQRGSTGNAAIHLAFLLSRQGKCRALACTSQAGGWPSSPASQPAWALAPYI